MSFLYQSLLVQLYCTVSVLFNCCTLFLLSLYACGTHHSLPHRALHYVPPFTLCLEAIEPRCLKLIHLFHSLLIWTDQHIVCYLDPEVYCFSRIHSFISLNPSPCICSYLPLAVMLHMPLDLYASIFSESFMFAVRVMLFIIRTVLNFIITISCQHVAPMGWPSSFLHLVYKSNCI